MITLHKPQSPNVTLVQIDTVLFVFSYQTCVAILDGAEWIVSENVWSRTTAKHLTQETPIPAKDRLPHDEFARRLTEITSRIEVRP